MRATNSGLATGLGILSNSKVQGLLVIVILVIVALGVYSFPRPHVEKKLVVDFWYESSGHWPQSADQAVLYKTQLERTGLITVNLHAADWATFRKMQRVDENLPVFLVAWPPDYYDPDDYAILLNSRLDAFHTNYRNPEMDRLVEKSRVTLDSATRGQLYDQIQKMMVNDVPFVPIWQGDVFAVTKPEVRGVVIDMQLHMNYWPIECPRDTLIVGTTDSVATNLDIVGGGGAFAAQVIKNTGATLVYVRPGSEGGPEDFVPGLATEWSASPDGLEWTFDLRQGVKFYDGTEFNATHVKYSFDRSLGLYLPISLQASLGYRDIIDNVEVTSKYEVVFHLKIPFAPFLSLMTCSASYIVNPELAPMDKEVEYVEGDARASNPNDLGPYVLTSWIRKSGKDYQIQYEANPNYWNSTGGYPKTKHIVFRCYSDSTALALAMKAGDIDMAFRQIEVADIKEFESDPNMKVWRFTAAFVEFICFQHNIAPFDNPKVRQAIAAALNREELVDTVFLGQAEPLYSVIPNGMIFHQDTYKILGDGNISLAVSILKELGYG